MKQDKANGKSRTTEIRVRLTKEEKQWYQVRATLAGLSISEYVRRAVENKTIVSPDIEVQLKQIKNEVNRIGVNLNQLTKLANTYCSEIEAEPLIDLLNDFFKELEQLQETVVTWVEDAD